MPKTKKSDTIICRVVTEDKKYIEKLTQTTGKNESECIRLIINAHRKGNKERLQSKEEFLKLKELVSEVNKIGNNINQVVKNNNSHLYNDYEKKKLFSLMEKLIDIVGEL